MTTRWTACATYTGELKGVAPTGNPVENPGTSVDQIVNGKIVGDWTAWDAFGLMQQLGIGSQD